MLKGPVWRLGKYSFVAQVFQAQQAGEKNNSEFALVEVTYIEIRPECVYLLSQGAKSSSPVVILSGVVPA